MTQQQIECSQSCVVTIRHEISFPPFNLTTGEAVQIGSAILLIWAVGFAFRAIIRLLRDGDFERTET